MPLSAFVISANFIVAFMSPTLIRSHVTIPEIFLSIHLIEILDPSFAKVDDFFELYHG